MQLHLGTLIVTEGRNLVRLCRKMLLCVVDEDRQISGADSDTVFTVRDQSHMTAWLWCTGASFFYEKGPVPYEAQEVRAFGLFLTDMVNLIPRRRHAPYQSVSVRLALDRPSFTVSGPGRALLMSSLWASKYQGRAS